MSRVRKAIAAAWRRTGGCARKAKQNRTWIVHDGRSVDEDRYSVYFTGRFLVPLDTAAVRQRLHALFPHADETHLAPFLAGRRVRLVHGETLDDAQTIARALMVHDFDTDIVSDAAAEVSSDIPLSPSGHAVAERERMLAIGIGERPHTDAVARHEGDEDRLTPRGRLAFRLFIILLLLATGLASFAALYNRPASDRRGVIASDLPATCVSQARSSFLGRVVGYELLCRAQNAAGGQYRLAVSCDVDGATSSIAVSAFGTDGRPRVPAWRASADGAAFLVVEYQYGEVRQSVRVQQGAQAHVAVFEAQPQYRLKGLLRAERVSIVGLFTSEIATFELGAARWYVDYFQGECGYNTGDRIGM